MGVLIKGWSRVIPRISQLFATWFFGTRGVMPRARMVGRCARKDGVTMTRMMLCVYFVPKANRNTEVGNRLIKMILPFVLRSTRQSCDGPHSFVEV
jgi:hypothetical protein